jgi:hypothetical protein
VQVAYAFLSVSAATVYCCCCQFSLLKDRLILPQLEELVAVGRIHGLIIHACQNSYDPDIVLLLAWPGLEWDDK